MRINTDKCIAVDIPGRGKLDLRFLVLDLNGTIALDGQVLLGVPERVAALQDRLAVYLLTADTHGTGTAIASQLNAQLHRLTPGVEARQKAGFVRALGAAHAAAVGNGTNDALMLAAAALGIGVLGQEGLATAALQAADLVVPNIIAALDLFIHPKRLIATLRQ